MKQERLKLVPFVAVMLRKGNKIILGKRIKNGWGNGEYTLPGGKLDGQETIRQACAREVKEELGVLVKPQDIKVLHVMHVFSKDNFEGIGFFLETEKWEGEPKNIETHIHESIGWYDLNNLPENMVGELKLALEKIRKNKIYSEHGWE
ncbi:NUDIX domain-containing protein [Candidatus Dependentiae bacterium]|nr:NUDIX domain-containing protein [Candidatus Dependentiae bacterium]